MTVEKGDRPLPYYKWLWQDWRSNRHVQRMTYIERGIYRELLDECWVEGSIPNDISALADIIGCPEDVMASAWQVLGKRFVLLDGRWHNEKIDSLRTERDALRVKRSKAGRKGGTAKLASIKENLANAKQNKTVADGSHIEEKSKRKNTPLPPVGGRVDVFFEVDFWPLYPRKVGRPIALRAFCKALERLKAEDVVTGGQIIVRGLEAHLARWRAMKSAGDGDKIPHASTWLNRDGWNDEVEPLKGVPQAKPVDPLKTQEGIMALAIDIGHPVYDPLTSFPKYRESVLVMKARIDGGQKRDSGELRAPVVGLEQLSGVRKFQ